MATDSSNPTPPQEDRTSADIMLKMIYHSLTEEPGRTNDDPQFDPEEPGQAIP